LEDGDATSGFWSRLPIAVQAVSGLVGTLAVLVGTLAAMGYFSGKQDVQTEESRTAGVHKIDPNIAIDQRAVLKNGINIFVYIRAHPSYESDRVATVSGEEVFLVGQERGGWLPVRLSSGNEGWVEKVGVQIIGDLYNFEDGRPPVSNRLSGEGLD